MAWLIVVQTGGMSAQYCKKDAMGLGLIEEKDVVFFDEDDVQLIMDQVTPDKEQILITGTFHGNRGSANQFVRDAKKKNPRLKAWFCSLTESGDSNGLYNYVVPVVRRYRHYTPMLEKAIRDMGELQAKT